MLPIIHRSGKQTIEKRDLHRVAAGVAQQVFCFVSDELKLSMRMRFQLSFWHKRHLKNTATHSRVRLASFIFQHSCRHNCGLRPKPVGIGRKGGQCGFGATLAHELWWQAVNLAPSTVYDFFQRSHSKSNKF